MTSFTQERLSSSYTAPPPSQLGRGDAKLRIEVLEGPAVLAAMERQEISDGWTALYDRCPWGTAGQRPEFVATWYRHYGDVHEPVLVLGFDEAQTLRGVLPLCRWNGGSEYRYGGHQDSEYEAWLADRPAADRFLPEAIEALDREFGKVDISLGYVSPGIPLDHLEAAPKLRARCRIQTEETLFLNTGEPDFATTYPASKKNARALTNRLRRRHGMRFRTFETTEEVRGAMERFQDLYDFRRGNTRGFVVFRQDTKKLPFLLELASHGLLHVSGLELDGRIMAMHVATADERRVPIVGLVHSEFAHNQSVGLALIFEMIQAVARQGVAVFDLTAGGDSYKTRFSGQTEAVHRIRIHASKRAWMQEALLQFARRGKRWLAGRLRRAWARLSKSAGSAENGQSPIEKLQVSPGSILSEASPPSLAAAVAGEWRLNDEGDLASIDPTNPSHFRFLSWVGRNARRGAKTMTRSQDGRLTHAWVLIPASHAHEEIELASLGDLPDDSSVLVEYPISAELSSAVELEQVLALIPPAAQGSIHILIPPQAPYATLTPQDLPPLAASSGSERHASHQTPHPSRPTRRRTRLSFRRK